MKPVRPAFDDDDLRPTDLSATARSLTETDPDDPLDPLKLRCASQLTKDIARLKTTKARLQTEIVTLQQDYERLQTDVQSLRHLADWAERGAAINPAAGGPLLPGEAALPYMGQAGPPSDERLELPIPATSAQRHQRGQTRQTVSLAHLQKGLVLSAIATVLAAWHYGLIGVLGQGGLWLGFEIGQLGTGFVPSVALLWLRMLVMVPVLVLLAPQLYANTWEDLQTWIYTQEQLLALLIGSGVAFFFSQALIYQSIGAIGPAVGVALLFLYPLMAVPLGARQEQAVTPLRLLALVAIAMGGWLVIRPALSTAPLAAILLGGLGSLCFGIYLGLTNLSYRQRCHPIPVSIVQFSTAAVLSSLVLLVKPLQLANISWLGFFLWGLLLGGVMLLAYLFNYSSLRLMGIRTAIVAAATPLVAVLLAWSFIPTPSLETIQWTGIALVTIGGVAFGKEKLSDSPQQ